MYRDALVLPPTKKLPLSDSRARLVQFKWFDPLAAGQREVLMFGLFPPGNVDPNDVALVCAGSTKNTAIDQRAILAHVGREGTSPTISLLGCHFESPSRVPSRLLKEK